MSALVAIHHPNLYLRVRSQVPAACFNSRMLCIADAQQIKQALHDMLLAISPWRRLSPAPVAHQQPRTYAWGSWGRWTASYPSCSSPCPGVPQPCQQLPHLQRSQHVTGQLHWLHAPLPSPSHQKPLHNHKLAQCVSMLEWSWSILCNALHP